MSRPLKDILYKVSINQISGSTAIGVNKIYFDSRGIESNDVFVAIRGTQNNGHLFINKAIEHGAAAVICEEMPDQIKKGVTYIEVDNSKKAMAYMAANYYDNPSDKLKLIGVTGTNGKTTVASLLSQLFSQADHKTGLLSTVKIEVDGKWFETSHTTPDVLSINFYLNKMVHAGVTHCFMEVSSHGIDQFRTEGLFFTGGIFTNLSHDHLDYHPTFAAYRDVKKRFFDQLPESAFALTNIDDKNGLFMIQNTLASKHTYALKTYANYTARVLENRFDGLLLKIQDHEIWTACIGYFNAYNLLAVFATARIMELSQTEILRLMSNLKTVEGRFQHFVSKGKINAIVDYAHTPDALKNVLATINKIRTGKEELITVVGCGGDRDKLKRPLMGRIASGLSSTAIFTSDNPRSEEPTSILRSMKKGVDLKHSNRVLIIENRQQAIREACKLAQTSDVVLVAGKGHETYQEIKGKKYPFDDYKILKQSLKELGK